MSIKSGHHQVVAGVMLAIVVVELDQAGVVPKWLIQSAWLYDGGGTVACTSSVASSTIAAAGMAFSITIG